MCKVRLGEVVDFLSGSTPNTSTSHYWNGMIPWASAKDLKSFYLWDTIDHISDAGAAAAATRFVNAGATLLLTRGMTLLSDVPIAIAKTRMSFNQDIKALISKPPLEPMFLPYLLVSVKTSLLAMVDLAGHGTGRLNTDELRRLKLELPSASEQRRIAKVLESLDEKIDLNRRMNETLEGIARTLLDELLARSTRRWEKRPLGDYVSLQRGTTYKSSLKGLPGPYLLGLGAIHRNGGFRGMKLETYGGDSPDSLLLRPGDIYVSLKDVTQSGDLLGAAARVPASVAVGRLTQDTVKLVPLAEDAPMEIIYRTLLSEPYREYCRAHATGTTNLGLSRDDFLAYPIVCPPDNLRATFDEQVEALNRRMELAGQESDTLAQLRDTLLPKLLSGELRVATAEKEFAQHV